MNKKAGDAKAGKAVDERQERLKAALKANLSRRKTQARARKAAETGPDKA